MKKYSKKGLEKRKEERKGYTEFYQKHIFIIKQENKKCAECGCNLMGDVSEVCHILPKSRFKSIAINDSNIIYLCCRSSEKNCHSKLDDSPHEVVRGMKIYPTIQERFEELKENIQEKLTWKDYELFEN